MQTDTRHNTNDDKYNLKKVMRCHFKLLFLQHYHTNVTFQLLLFVKLTLYLVLYKIT